MNSSKEGSFCSYEGLRGLSPSCGGGLHICVFYFNVPVLPCVAPSISPCIFVFHKKRKYALEFLHSDDLEVRMMTRMKSFKDMLRFNIRVRIKDISKILKYGILSSLFLGKDSYR